MLTIRPAQMEALRQSARRQFARDVVSLLRTHFPEQTSGVGMDQLTLTVENAITVAEGKGIQARANICKFVILIFAFGDQCRWDPGHFLYPALSPDTVSDEDIDYLYARLAAEPEA